FPLHIDRLAACGGVPDQLLPGRDFEHEHPVLKSREPNPNIGDFTEGWSGILQRPEIVDVRSFRQPPLAAPEIVDRKLIELESAQRFSIRICLHDLELKVCASFSAQENQARVGAGIVEDVLVAEVDDAPNGALVLEVLPNCLSRERREEVVL